jgi:hypothetical protein
MYGTKSIKFMTYSQKKKKLKKSPKSWMFLQHGGPSSPFHKQQNKMCLDLKKSTENLHKQQNKTIRPRICVGCQSE